MNIGTFFAIDRDRAEDYVTQGFRLGYVEGSDLNDDAVLSALARAMDWPVEEFLSYLESSDGQERYAACNVQAHERGVFGVPIMMLGEEMWWGNDRLEFMRRHLENS